MGALFLYLPSILETQSRNLKYMFRKLDVKAKALCLSLLLFMACGPDDVILVSTDIIRNASEANLFIESTYDDMVIRSLFADAFVMVPLLFSDNCNYTGNDNDSWIEASDMEIDPENVVNWEMFTDLYSINTDLNTLFGQLDTTEHSTLDDDTKNQFRAEGRAIRAVMYYYLNSYWGNVPIVDEDSDPTDTTLTNATAQELYDFIEGDLLFANENIGSSEYADNSQRLGKGAIKAWLARFYLQNGEWDDALSFAEEVIALGTFELEENFSNVFDINSNEHIWVMPEDLTSTSFAFWFLQPFANGLYVVRPRTNIPFEDGDARRSVALSVPGTTVIKYNDISTNSDPAYLFRMSEIYLIAAEAAARSADYSTASQYFNVVRNRAGLEDATLDADNFTDAILQERNAELCYEGFHRLLDLRRFDKAEEILGEFGYDSKDALWPVPQRVLDNLSSIEQNDGY